MFDVCILCAVLVASYHEFHSCVTLVFMFLPNVVRHALRCGLFQKKTYNLHLNGDDESEFDPLVYAYHARIDPHQSQLAVSTSNHVIKIYDLETASLVNQLDGHTNSISALEYDPETPYLIVSSSGDQQVKAWDLRTNQAQITYKLQDPVSSCSVRCCEVVAAAGETISNWHLSSSVKPKSIYHYVHNDEVTKLSFLPSSGGESEPSLLFSSSLDGLVVSLDLSNPDLDSAITQVYHTGASGVQKFGFFRYPSASSSPWSMYILTTTEQLQLWDLDKSLPRLDFGSDLREKLSQGNEEINYIIDCLYDSLHNRLLLYAGNFQGPLSIYELERDRFEYRTTLKAHSSIVRDVAWHPSAEQAVTVGEDSKVVFWQLNNDHVNDDETKTTDQRPKGGGRDKLKSLVEKSEKQVRSKPY